MQILNQLLLLIINFLITISTAQAVPTIFCGKFQIKEPLLSLRMTLCKSQKPYFRTSLGLIPISSINYTTKTLTITHPSSSSTTRKYISPSLLTAGFPSPPPPSSPNSVLLINCSSSSNNIHHHMMYAFTTTNCTGFHVHGDDASEVQDFKVHHHHHHQSCFLIDDLDEKKLAVAVDFHPKDLNCSHYRRVYRRNNNMEDVHGSNNNNKKEEVGLGTRISFDIPDDHVPDICKECEKPNGNCGVGLKCICHPKDCKDKVISLSGSMNPAGNILFSLLSFTVFMVLWSHG